MVNTNRSTSKGLNLVCRNCACCVWRRKPPICLHRPTILPNPSKPQMTPPHHKWTTNQYQTHQMENDLVAQESRQPRQQGTRRKNLKHQNDVKKVLVWRWWGRTYSTCCQPMSNAIVWKGSATTETSMVPLYQEVGSRGTKYDSTNFHHHSNMLW